MRRTIIKCMRSEDGWLVGWLIDYMGKHLCDAKLRIFHLEWRHIFDWSNAAKIYGLQCHVGLIDATNSLGRR